MGTLYISENEVAKVIVNAAYNVHVALGPGLLESAYEACLIYELVQAGLEVKSQLSLPIVYREIKLDCGYRIDVLVENLVVIEIKSVSTLNDTHLA